MLETKIHRLEVNVELNGLGENDITLPWKNGRQEDANTRLISPNQATKTQQAIVKDNKSSSGSPTYNALGAKPKDNSIPWKIRGHNNASTPVNMTQLRTQDQLATGPQTATEGEHATTQLINYGNRVTGRTQHPKTQPWITAKGKSNVKPSHQPSLKLKNRFDPLSPDASSHSDDTSTPSRVRIVNKSESRKLQRKLTRPQTLIVGDAAVNEIRSLLSKNTKIFCFPKDMVSDLAERIENIVATHPTAKAIVLHTGANDVVKEHSEILKKDFSDLLDKLSSLDIKVFISGPLPPISGGDMRFSRLRALSKFLSRTCEEHSVKFIDNFTIFWERRHLFKADGLCLNKAGVKMFTLNLFHFLHHQLVSSAKDRGREQSKQQRKQEITERPRDTEGELPGDKDGQPSSEEETPSNATSSPSLPPQVEGPPPPGPTTSHAPPEPLPSRDPTPPQTPPRPLVPTTSTSPSSPGTLSPSSPLLEFSDELKRLVTEGIKLTPRADNALNTLNLA